MVGRYPESGELAGGLMFKDGGPIVKCNWGVFALCIRYCTAS